MTLVFPHWHLLQFACSVCTSSSWHSLITPVLRFCNSLFRTPAGRSLQKEKQRRRGCLKCMTSHQVPPASFVASCIKSCFLSLNISSEAKEPTWMLLLWSKTQRHFLHGEGWAPESLFCPIPVNRASARWKETASFPEVFQKNWLETLEGEQHPFLLGFFYKLTVKADATGAELVF